MAQSKGLNSVFILSSVANVKEPRFGAKGDGVTDDTVALQAAFAAITAGTVKVLYFPQGDYMTTETLELSDVRGFSLIGEGGSSGDVISRIHKVGAGASDDGVLRLSSVTDYKIEGLDFIIIGDVGAKQAVELRANDIPSLSCLLGKITNCLFRRISTTPEFTVAALALKNVAMLEIDRCMFPMAAVAMRIGEDNGVDPSTYGNGSAGTMRIARCQFFGDVERRNIENTTFDTCVFDLKSQVSPTEPSVLTVSGDKLCRLERIINCYCDPGATTQSRTFIIQGDNISSRGLEVRGCRIGDVALGVDVTAVQANALIEGNNFLLGNNNDIGVRIASTVQGFATVGTNDFSSMTGTGSQRVDDNRTVLFRPPLISAASMASYTITASNAWETAHTISSVRLRGGRVKVSYSLTFTGSQDTSIRARVTINGVTYNQTSRAAYHTSGEQTNLSLTPMVIYIDDPGTTCTVLVEVFQVTGATLLTMVGNASTGSSNVCIEQVP